MIKLFANSQILKKDEKLKVVREQVAIYKDGKPLKPQNIEFQLIGNVQPLNGRDLLLVPEHDRTKEQLWIYLDNQQFVVNMGLEVKGQSYILVNDRIIRLCGNYQVQSVENWGTYTKIRIMLIDVGPYAQKGVQ